MEDTKQIVVENDIVKSEEDKKEYRGITLPNGIQALLVSDTTADMASVSMTVNVGYFSDPKHIPGLAHFLEHMLFLGTEKYPDENDYDEFLAENGGSSNAYTGQEYTNYFFDISYNKIEPALDRFAQFFISPLFSVGATEREMNAVNSEHKKNLQDDTWRTYQLLYSTSNPNHPFSNFGTGDIETLGKHADIRDQLLKFHAQYYSSNLMRLVILSRESLDQLQEWVISKFSSVKNINANSPSFPGEPLTPDNLKIIQFYTPVKDLRKLNLIWPIPAQQSLWRSKPAQVVSHLIGHEGAGSILSYLKKKSWANELIAGTLFEGTSYSFFGIVLHLTDEGLNHVNEIIDVVYQYINLLKTKGIDKWVYDELKLLDEIEFRFKDQPVPIALTSQLSIKMHMYPIKHVLSGSNLLYEWEPEKVKEVIDALNPNNMRLCLISKTFNDEGDLEEPWYKFKYSQKPIEEELFKRWSNPSSNSDLYLAHPNPFLPTDFTPKKPSEDKITKYPVATKNNQSTLWYKFDSTFNVPKCYIYINLITPVVYENPKSIVLAKLYTNMISDALNEYAYDAEVAGLRYGINNSTEGIQLSLKGFNCKQQLLLEKILEKLVKPDFKEERYKTLMETLVRSYTNFWKEKPYQRAIYQLDLTLDNVRYSNEDYITVVNTINFEDIVDYAKRLFQTLYAEILIVGNSSYVEAEAIRDKILLTLNAKPLTGDQYKKKQQVKLNPGKTYLYPIETFAKEDENSAIENFYEFGVISLKNNCILDLFVQCSSQQAFNQLRTKEQLGYIVWAGPIRQNGTQGFSVIIQSDKKDATHLDERIESWIAQYKKELEDLSDADLENFKQGLITQKLEKDKSLKAEYSRWHKEITLPRAHFFNRAEEEAKEIATITKADIIQFFENFVSSNSQTRKKFTCQVFGKGKTLPTYDNLKDNEVLVNDYKQLRQTHELYPIHYDITKDMP